MQSQIFDSLRQTLFINMYAPIYYPFKPDTDFHKSQYPLSQPIRHLSMILSNTYEVRLQKTYKKILFLHAAYNDSFVFLAIPSHKKEVIVHVDTKGKVLFQASFDHPMFSMGLLNDKQVILIETRKNRICILSLQNHEFSYFPHYFMFLESDQNDIITFSETKYLCIEERGRYSQNRYRLTYYKYPLQLTQKKTTKTVAVYQSKQDEWTYQHKTKKANNFSMMMWYKPKHDDYFQFKIYEIQNEKGYHHIYKFNQAIASQSYLSKVETVICNAWQMKKDKFMFVCLTHKAENKKTDGSIINNNYVIDVSKGNIRQSQFTFGPYQDYLIDCYNLGPNAMFRTFKIEEYKILSSPTYFIDNQTQQIIAEEEWMMSHLYKYEFEGFASGLMCEGLYENEDVKKFTVILKRIVKSKDIYLFLLSQCGMNLEIEFIEDVLNVLT